MMHKARLTAGKHAIGRQAVWEAIRELRTFTTQELRAALRHAERARVDAIQRYVLGLVRGEYVSVAQSSPPSYTLVRDVGVDAPRIRDNGTPVRWGMGLEQMWRTMRILGGFSARELAVHASTAAQTVTPRTASAYIQYLALAGYLVMVYRGIPRHENRYRFVPSRYSGPKPPRVRQKSRPREVFDPNINKVVWCESEDEQT